MLTLLLSLTFIIGCNSKADEGSKEPTQNLEVISANELSSDSVSVNTISENFVSENTISENMVNEEESINEEQVNINDYLKNEKFIEMYNAATPMEQEIIQVGFSRFVNNANSQSDRYSSILDLTTDYGGKYKDQDALQFQKKFQQGYVWGLLDTQQSKDQKTYVGIGNSDNPEEITFWQSVFVRLDDLSILSMNSDPSEFYLIINYQGEEVIPANTYVDVVTNEPISKELIDFSITPAREYLIKIGYPSLDGPSYSFPISVFTKKEFYNK